MTAGIEWVWADEGDQVPPADRGLAYGHGVFETIRVQPAGLLLEDYHRDRLLQGCRALGIGFDGTGFDLWRSEALGRGLLETAGEGRILKLTVTAGSGGRGYRMPSPLLPRVITATTPAPPIPAPGSAVRVRSCAQRARLNPSLPGLKTLERLDQVLASAELGNDDFEGLMFDSGGYPLEGTRTNIFVPVEDELVTPPADQLAVMGTLRRWLGVVLPGLGWQLVERTVTPDMIRQNGLLLGNSVMGLVPATMVDDVRLPVGHRAQEMRDEVSVLLGLD